MPTILPGSPSMSSSIACLLEGHAPFGDEHLLLAFAVGDNDALAIHVLDAGGDERGRAPHQIDEGVPLLLAHRAGLVRPDQLRVDVLVGDAGRYHHAPPRCRS